MNAAQLAFEGRLNTATGGASSPGGDGRARLIVGTA